jgi:DNA-binding MarR family transcriptional regulator
MATRGIGEGGGRTLLEDLGRDLTHLAAMIVHLAENDASRRQVIAGQAPVTAQQVGFLISTRHARSAVFDLDLANAGWSVLLELYHARLEGRTVRISRLATDARIATATAMRWLDQLGGHGLVERRPDPQGGRGVVVSLTEQGGGAMDDHFAAMKTGWALG